MTTPIKPTPPTPVKAKAVTKAQQITDLQKVVTTRDTEIARLHGRILELEEILATRQRMDTANAKVVAADKRALTDLLAAIKPVEEATRTWTWPSSAGLALLRKLTFGHLKGIIEAYQKALSR